MPTHGLSSETIPSSMSLSPDSSVEKRTRYLFLFFWWRLKKGVEGFREVVER